MRAVAGDGGPGASSDAGDASVDPALHGLRPGERDRRLAGQGWVRRFVAGPDRLEEAAELYRELGHEVRLERPTEEELAEACEDCALAMELFRILYTRRRE